jgi:ribosomal protein S18 acetylase RimI-like enzyme
MDRCVPQSPAEKGRFAIPAARARLPPCNIRPIDGADFDACAMIYRLNGAAQLPPAYWAYFLDWLHTREAQVFVAEVNREVRGFGGLTMHQQINLGLATLSYGTVHPTHHGHGFGTALLLGRLAMVPESEIPWEVFASTTSDAGRYYQQFGFSWVGRFPRQDGTSLDLYSALFDRAGQKTCHAALREASIFLAPSSGAGPPITAAV